MIRASAADRLACDPQLEHLSYYSSRACDVKVRPVFHLGKMRCEPITSLGGIVEAGLSDQRQDQIVDRSHDLAGVSNGHAEGIFLQGNIAATPAATAGAV